MATTHSRMFFTAAFFAHLLTACSSAVSPSAPPDPGAASNPNGEANGGLVIVPCINCRVFCGGTGEAPCVTGGKDSCTDWNQLTASSPDCQACGHAGQAACGGAATSSAETGCQGPAVLDAATNSCVSCVAPTPFDDTTTNTCVAACTLSSTGAAMGAWNGECVACGGQSEIPCAAGASACPGCASNGCEPPNNVATFGSVTECYPCGASGQSSCEGTCLPGLWANPNTSLCEPIPGCGGNDEIPCSGNACDPGYTPNPVGTDNVCVPCGATGQYACETVGVGFSCNAGNNPTASGGATVCVECGHANELQCLTGSACVAGTVPGGLPASPTTYAGAAGCLACGGIGAPPGPGGCCGGVLGISGTQELCVSGCGQLNELPCVNGGCTQFDTRVNAGSSTCGWPTDCGSNGQGCCDAGNAFQTPNGTGPYNQIGATQDVCHDGSQCSWGPGANALFSWQWWCGTPSTGVTGTGLSCPSGEAQGTYYVCVTCPESDSFNESEAACSSSQAVTNAQAQYNDACQVVAGDCSSNPQ